MQKSKANILLWCVVAVVGMSITGCLKATDPQPQPAKAYISIMQLATQPPAFSTDIYFNTTKVTSNAFGAGGVSQAYSAVDKGAFSVSFKKAGGDSVMASIPLSQYDSLGFYTIIMYNNQGTPATAEAMLVEDDFSDLTLDKPYFRFFHASPSVSALGPVDVYIDNNKVFTQRVLADNEFSGFYNQFQPATTGSHIFSVKLSSNDSLIAKTATDVNLISGNAYTIYLAGNTGGTGVNALTVGALRAAN
ncbi:DUF4397 domain-containing protein [Paraflavitalea soli]|uniref:DUF4397 domain-containing protein n=1 Tax=Paraflavitalea soli TaxID=2315862 RepID=A0A3B7MPN4_9BACT|nr:DUF4397 domain-containing protein [Paraflavitalea soli]AXY75273.1 DUF4397 domain-containing protein [Paraflavitalea soli]